MAGMERNSDVVSMASYAPLFVNVKHRGWNPDLIGYDTSRTYGIPSYYVQQMFSVNRGDVILPINVECATTSGGPASGMVGVGTWLTQAEFKDMKVTHDGQTLLDVDLSKGKEGWRFAGGDWSVRDGSLIQTGAGENIHAIIGDKNWTDYTFSLKARKISGNEGFLIMCRAQDENDRSWWNIGGWGNTRHGLEIGAPQNGGVEGHIETGRWYDIRVEVKGNSIKCYLDDVLVHDAHFPVIKSLFASATRVKSSGEVILKVVNASPDAQNSEIKLNGVSTVNNPVRGLMLTSESGNDENTLDKPTKVAPVPVSMDATGNTLRYRFPGNSVTVLRVKAQ